MNSVFLVLFRFYLSFCMNFGELCFSRNLSILSQSNLLNCFEHKFFQNISLVTIDVCRICCNVLTSLLILVIVINASFPFSPFLLTFFAS